MPKLRPGVGSIPPYEAGRPIEEVARSLGLAPDEVIKLASNEYPLPPFPEVIEAMKGVLNGVNRYPDNGWYELARAVAEWVGVEPDQLMFGGGSSELIRIFALALGGPGTSVVYPWPSFVIYRLAPKVAGSETIEVGLTGAGGLDPDALAAAIRPDTTLLYICNPNNPTGAYLSADAVKGLIDRVPESVLVVVDEAYHEYVTAPDYTTAVGEALARPNVVVTRTFSKIFALAALRIGYAIGRSETLLELRRAQAPFTVGTVAQVAAMEAIRHPDQVADRSSLNRAERERLEAALADRRLEYVPSQANFVYLRPRPGRSTFDEFLRQGVIVRVLHGDWVRASIGLPAENDRFLAALDGLASV
ncbi:MAG: histidinol-phosphate transaminase [Actinomycetota bacterium]